MKKSKHGNTAGKRSTKSNNNPVRNDSITPKVDSIDEDDQGFGGWLRSTEGMENMKLFVIANSIVLLTTLAYPHLQIVIELVTDALYGPDGLTEENVCKILNYSDFDSDSKVSDGDSSFIPQRDDRENSSESPSQNSFDKDPSVNLTPATPLLSINSEKPGRIRSRRRRGGRRRYCLGRKIHVRHEIPIDKIIGLEKTLSQAINIFNSRFIFQKIE